MIERRKEKTQWPRL